MGINVEVLYHEITDHLNQGAQNSHLSQDERIREEYAKQIMICFDSIEILNSLLEDCEEQRKAVKQIVL